MDAPDTELPPAHDTNTAPAMTPRRRWSMLALGVFAQASSSVFVHGTPFLLPALTAKGMPLATAGLLVAMPTIAQLCTLIAWGWLVDRIGERTVLLLGPALMGVAGLGAAFAANYQLFGILLFLGGIGAASTNGASGRVIAGWFPPEWRGLAMGIRQTAQPLGVGIGALAIPNVASAAGVTAAMLVPAGMGVAAALGCRLGIVDPPRPPVAQAERQNPYRGSWTLWRIHGVSVLLVIPQATVWTFGLLWLHRDVGLSLPAAGVLVTLTQVLGALGRVAAGAWSDRVGSRMGPLRMVAVAAVVTMGALGFTAMAHWWWLAVPLLVLASVVTVSDNGLAFTAITELAGPFWSGRGLGIQNTGQYLALSAVPPLFGALIAMSSIPTTYLVAALLAGIAIALVPADHLSRES